MQKKELLPSNVKNVKTHFSALTGMRAVAAFMVYCHHFNPFPGGTLPFGLANELHIGVTIFFVLSGFLITYRYLDHFEPSVSWLKPYFLNRLVRIYPVYFLLTTLTFIIYFFNEGYSDWLINFYFLNITFLKGFFDLLKFSGIPQGWSLTVEECFYFTAPIIFLLYKKKNVYFFLIPIIFLAMGFLLVGLFSKFDFYGLFSNIKFMLLYTFFGRCTEFFIGTLLALFIRSDKGKNMDTESVFFTTIGAILILVSLVVLSYIKGVYPFGLYHPLGLIINNAILPVFILVFFLGLIYENTFFRWILETTLFTILGKISFIFYLIHLGAIQVLINTYIVDGFFSSYLVFNIFSIALFFLFEKPVNSQIRAFFRNSGVFHNN